MNKIKSIILFSLSFVVALSFFAEKISATSVDVKSNPLGVASTFKYFATGNVTFDSSVGDINSRIAADTIKFNQQTYFNLENNPAFESDSTLKNPVLVLNQITSDNQTLLRGIGTSNASNNYIADSVSLPESVDGTFLTNVMLNNVKSRKSYQGVSYYFNSLSSGINSFSKAKEQLQNISAEYATNTENNDATVSSNIQNDGSERFDITLSSNSSSASVIYLNVNSSASGISIHVNNSITSNLPYIIVNWSNRRNGFSWGSNNSYSVSGVTGASQDWVSHIINNFPDTKGSVSLNNGLSGEQFIGSIFAPYASSVNLGNYANSDNKVYSYIANVVSGGDINVSMFGAGNNDLINSTNFTGTTPTIDSVKFTNGSNSQIATISNGTTIPVTASTTNATTAEITPSSDLGSNYHTFVKGGNGSWQSFTNDQTTISSLTGYSKSLTSSSANATSTTDDTTTIGLNLQRSNMLTFAIAKTSDPTKVDTSTPTTFTTTLDETGTLTATMPTTTSIGDVALGSTTGTTSSGQPVSFTNTFGVNASLTVSLSKDTTITNLFYDPTVTKIKIGDNSLDAFSASADTMSDSKTLLNNVNSNTSSTTFALNVALGSSTEAMKEVTPGQSYTIPLYWSISYSGNGN